MPNFIASYDLNGPKPTHAEMDDHIRTISGKYGRVLESVWYIGVHGQTAGSLRDYLGSILGSEDRLLVVECREASWSNLLINSPSLKEAWDIYR